MKKFNFQKTLLLSLVAVFAVAGLIKNASAQDQAGDVPQELLPLAQELGCASRNECEKAFNDNFEKGLDLAEKYKIYGEEQNKIAQSFKQEIIAKLSGASDENFDEMVIKIANDILKKPSVAKTLKIDKEEVKAAETIVTEVKNAGVSLDICSQSAESLTREQLISCFEASKKLSKQSKIVEKYIPRGVKEKTEMLDSAVKLEEALAKGEYQGLGKTAEEVGQECLRPGSESLTVCDEIAAKFFGPEGVKELAAARTQTRQAGDSYLKGLENLELVTPDGRKITGKDSIRKTCDRAFEARDVGLAKACGDFAVKNGFASKEEIESSIKIFESFAAKPQVDFDQCRVNPEACREFIPEEFKGDFDSGIKVYEIMKSEMGFDPMQCERARFDFELGQKCLEASQKALPKLKELAKSSGEAQRMVSEIEFRIKQGEEYGQKKNEFEKTFVNQGGPGGCKSPQECYAYCSDPAHGAECIAFGAKHEVFDQKEAVTRFQQYNQALVQPIQAGAPGNFGGASNNGQYPYNYQGEPVGPSPECFAAIQSGDFAKAKEICAVPQHAAPFPPPPPYRSDSSAPSVMPIRTICPAMPEIDCPDGYQKIYKPTPDGCGRSECAPFQKTICPEWQYWKVTGQNNQGYCAPVVEESHSYSSSSYPYNEEKERCYRSGGSWVENYCKYPEYNRSSSNNSASSYGYSSYSNYSSSGYTSCSSDLVALLGTGCHQMFTDFAGRTIYCNGEMNKSAKAGDTAVAEGCNPPASSYSSSGYSSSYSNYSSYNYVPPTGQKEQVWNSYGLRSWIRSDADTARIESLKQVCANVTSGENIWMTGAGDYNSHDFGMPDENKCRTWTSSSQSSYSSYPGNYSSSSSNYSSYSYSSYGYSQCDWSTQYFKNSTQACAPRSDCYNTASADYNSSECQGVRGYNSSSGYSSSYGNYSSYNYSSASACPTNLLGTGCHDMNNAYFNGAMDQYVNYGGSTVKNCLTEYINGCTSWSTSSYSSYNYSSAGGSYSSTGGTSYSSYDQSAACSAAGGTWTGSYCQMPQSSSAAYSSASPDPSAACAQAGGTWDGATCVMPGTTLNGNTGSFTASLSEIMESIFGIFSR